MNYLFITFLSLVVSLNLFEQDSVKYFMDGHL